MSHDNQPFIEGQLDLLDQLNQSDESTTMGTIKYVVSDVRTHEDERSENKTILIPHCCNDLGVMGAGVAAALRKMWPTVFYAYASMPMDLGKVGFVPVEVNEFDEPTKFVVNMIGQHDVRGNGNDKPVRYMALGDAMREILSYIKLYKIENPIIHAPMFGAALAGGDWRVIEALIEEILLPHMDVTICVIEEDMIPLWRRDDV